jgi:hypothetical protein
LCGFFCFAVPFPMRFFSVTIRAAANHYCKRM